MTPERRIVSPMLNADDERDGTSPRMTTRRLFVYRGIYGVLIGLITISVAVLVASRGRVVDELNGRLGSSGAWAVLLTAFVIFVAVGLRDRQRKRNKRRSHAP